MGVKVVSGTSDDDARIVVGTLFGGTGLHVGVSAGLASSVGTAKAPETPRLRPTDVVALVGAGVLNGEPPE